MKIISPKFLIAICVIHIFSCYEGRALDLDDIEIRVRRRLDQIHNLMKKEKPSNLQSGEKTVTIDELYARAEKEYKKKNYVKAMDLFEQIDILKEQAK